MAQPAKRKIPTLDQLRASDKVCDIRLNPEINDDKLAEILGIAKVTLYTRLEVHNWKKPELALIKNLKK